MAEAEWAPWTCPRCDKRATARVGAVVLCTCGKRSLARRPYVVQQDGTVLDRATRQRVGMVHLTADQGWAGYLLGPDYPGDPRQQIKVDAGMAGRPRAVARAVWEAHLAGSGQ